MKSFENVPSSTENKSEVTPVTEEKIISAEEINPAVVEEMKAGDALKTEAAQEELESFNNQEKAKADSEQAELLALAKEKLEEMKTRAEKNSKSFLGKLFSGKDQLAKANAAINNAMKMANNGELPNMYKVMESAKVDVDLSGFERKKGAVLSAGNSTGYNVTSKF
jgi:regulator of protease activity HflC (stomatin/prohibitin superfamily)